MLNPLILHKSQFFQHYAGGVTGDKTGSQEFQSKLSFDPSPFRLHTRYEGCLMRRLLIIDDQKDLLLLYKIEFESEGYHVDTARNARKALNMSDKKHYDLIILEINLPGIDGKELMGKLLVRDKKIPIIINSASYRYHDFFMSWAADSYVLKSSDLTELKQKVKESLSESISTI